MKTVKWLVSIGVTFTLFATVVKGFTIDGSYEAGYGTALATQAIASTGLHNDIGLIDQSDGSELDAAYGVISNGVLYLFFAGNLDAGQPSVGVPYDKLHVFIMTDSGAGGDHTLGTNYSYNADFGHPNRMGVGGNGADAGSQGLTFDVGFSANYDVEVTAGATNLVTMYANLFQICSNCPGYYLGSASPSNTMTDSQSGLNTGIQVALNNSNTNGIGGDINGCYVTIVSTNNPLNVPTGVEMAIPLNAIGGPLSSVSICAFITKDDCSALYNQVLGPVWDGTTDGSFCEFTLTGDGDSSEVNLSGLPGTHHFGLAVPSCSSVQVSPLSFAFPSSGGSSSVSVTMNGGCGFTASSSTNWITITGGSPGSGSGTVTFSVSTNTSINPRSALLYVIGSTYSITQAVTITQDGVTLPPLGAIVIDGTKDPGYGCPVTVQAIGTGYGKSVSTNIGTSTGSELDAAYGLVQNNTLFLLLTGKLESNNNHLHMFFMTGPGGTNTLNSGIVEGQVTNIGGDILNVMGGTTNGATLPATGLTFDPSFGPNYYMNVNIGNPYHIYLDYAQLWPGGTNASGQCTNGYFVGGSTSLTNGTLIPGHNPYSIQCTVNNSSSTNGVDGSSCTTNATLNSPWNGVPNVFPAVLVTNGVELAIPLAAIGSPTGQIAICAIIGGGSGGYMSNQVLPPIVAPADGGCSNNLAGNNNANTVNIGSLPGGPHYFTVGPEMRVTSVTIPAGTTNVAVSYLPENNTNWLYQLQRRLAPLTNSVASDVGWNNVGALNEGGPSIITVTDLKAATNKVGVIYRVRQSPHCN